MLMRSFTYVAIAIVASLGSLVGQVHGDDSLWLTDFEKAQAQAKAEKKLLLVDFTGSDWCPPCMRLKQEVFDGAKFKAEAPKQFVLVELDFPNSKEQPEELKLQNRLLQRRYSITGFPSVLIMDPAGNKITKTGYRPGGDEEYVKHLQDLVATYEGLASLKGKLNGLTGLERAKLLDEIVTGVDKLGSEGDDSQKLSEEVIALDSDNKAGLKVKHAYRLVMAEAKKLLQERKTDEAKAAFDKALALEGITAEQKQQTHFSLGECYFAAKNYAQVLVCLEQAHAAAPMSEIAENLKQMIERFAPLAKAQATVEELKGKLATAEGLDRAKLLDELIEATKKTGRIAANSPEARQIETWKEEIIALDSENKAGLKDKYSK
jgi:thioredoxin-related protein